MFIVYKYTSPNGKLYIGKTSVRREKTRKYEHKYDAEQNKDDYYFHKAIRKYGFDNFKYEIICRCLTEQIAVDIEDALILHYNTINKNLGYNSKVGAGCSKLTEEVKDKIRIKAIGRKQSEETINKRIETKTKNGTNIIADKTRKKISEANSGKKFSDEHRKKISDATIGRKQSDETKKKISEATSGVNHPLYGKKGKLASNAKPIEYWETKSSGRANFKKTCERMNWDFNDFEEIESGDKIGLNKKYYYKLKKI